MKNLYLLSTNKPSKLYYNNNDSELQICEVLRKSTPLKENKHIYITSEEEIKKGNWCLWLSLNKVIKCEDNSLRDRQDMVKKIILTTDPSLIKNDVQAIDDDFLEWFIQNQTCEKVIINNYIHSTKNDHIIYYQILLTQKTEQVTSLMEKFKPLQEKWQIDFDNIQKITEAAEFHVKSHPDFEAEEFSEYQNGFFNGFIDGAMWQIKNSYSEEELKKIINEIVDKTCTYFHDNLKKEYAKDLYQQFKKIT